MPSPSLALPGVLFVGEDERARLVAHLGAAAGWMIPKGIMGWSTEVSVVARDALSEQVRRDAKIVMPEEQIPPAKMPLTHQAALKSPLVGVSSRLTQKLVDAGIRVHTVGADRVTSSFYYIAEGGGEDPVRVEGDLVAAVGQMLGERADNAAIERVLDGLVDRLLRSLSKDRVAELSLELAAALPRAAADGSGMQDVDLDAFEKELAQLVGSSEKYTPFLKEIASKIAETNERKVEIPLYGDARKVSQGPFELQVGEKKVGLSTYERWLATGPLSEPAAKAATPAPKPVVEAAKPAVVEAAKPAPAPVAVAKAEPAKPVEAKPTTPKPAPATTTATATATAPPPNVKPLAAPMNPPRPASNPPAKEAPKQEAPKQEAPKQEPVAAAAPAKEPEVIKQSGSTERPKPAASTPEPEVPKAAPIPSPNPPAVQPAPTPSPSPAAAAKAAPTPSPSPVAAAKAAPISKPDVHPRDDRNATTQKVKRKEKGMPWLWIIVLIAAAFAGYRLYLSRMK